MYIVEWIFYVGIKFFWIGNVEWLMVVEVEEKLVFRLLYLILKFGKYDVRIDCLLWYLSSRGSCVLLINYMDGYYGCD